VIIGRRALLAAGPALAATGSGAQFLGGATSILDFVPPGERSAIAAGRSNYDVSDAILAAWARAPGAIWFPAGRYVIARPVRFPPRDFAGRFASAPVLFGDGVGRTVLINRVARGAMFDVDAGASETLGFRAFTGLRIEDFTIDGGNSADGAIRLRTCLQGSLRRLHILNHRGTGVHVPCLFGDTDGSNQLRFEQIRVENCAGWGVDTYASSGHNENSFLTFDQLFVQNCGTPSSARFPTSGGMRHKGQVMALRQCAFTLNQNVGLWLPGDAGLGSGVTIDETAFENNIGRHLYCTGYDAVRARNIQFYSADAYRVRVACEFSGENYVMRGIDIDGVTVRATKGNAPYLVFRFGGVNLVPELVRVAGIVLENFGFPGQSLIEGPVPILSDNRKQDVRQ
jgi:hypothetical protein